MDYTLNVRINDETVNNVLLTSELTTYYVYDDHRFFSKMYVLLKFIGLLFYTTTLTLCDRPEVYIISNVVMFLSAANSARYEYRHYQRYGTIFSSLEEYQLWKKNLWPKSCIIFSAIELTFKFGYFIYIFPPKFVFNTVCNIGQSIFLIHIIILGCIYILTCIFSCWLIVVSIFIDRNSVPKNAFVQNFTTSIIVENEECCICLNTTNVKPWVLLPCGHKYHDECISTWLNTRDTCPVCRDRVRPSR